MYSVYKNEMRLIPTCFRMEEAGIKLDVGYTLKALEHENALIKLGMQEFKQLTGREYQDSNKLFAEVFKESGDAFPTTEKGNPSFNADSLEAINTPVANAIKRIREHEKRAGTYYSSFLHFVANDGRIHASINQSGTTTGRFSYSNPNLQNLSKEDEEEDKTKPYVVRGCFVTDPGFNFVSLDYSQVEYRLMLDYAGETEIIRQVNEGADLHQAMADMVGISRNYAKTLNFACIAEDSLVLTNMGLVPIQDVTLSHLLWDGIEWIPHDGVVYQGEKLTYEAQGLQATEDHQVYTTCGRKIPFGACTTQQTNFKIAITEIKGKPVRYKVSSGENIRQRKKASQNKGWMYILWKSKMGRLRESVVREIRNLSVPDKQKNKRSQEEISTYPTKEILGCSHEMHKPEIKILEKLWCTWNTRKVHYGRVRKLFLNTLHRKRNLKLRRRQNKQQWSLRDREHASCNQIGKFKEPKIVKVYDILNAGPRHRFTVSGKLVSNCLYGSGAANIAYMLDMTEREAKQLRDTYFRRLPKVSKFIKKVMQVGEYRGYVRNWLGRECHINHRDYAYKLPNHLIQGGAADVIKVAMNKIDDLLMDKRSQMLVQIHDDILHSVHENEMDLVPQIKEIMDNVYQPKNGMRLTVSPEISKRSWAYRDFEKLQC